MKAFITYLKTTIELIFVVTLVPACLIAQDIRPKKIIYETDMCADVDDVGGLGILQALANNGEAEILAVTYNEVHPDAAAAIDAINTWYGRGDIPIGIYRGTLRNPDWSSYLEHVAKFPHDLENEDAPSALDVYRQVLRQQPDSSVTIVSVGFLNNLNDLLLAEPDLVAQKVKELVQMAGVWDDGFNLVRHNLASASENVIENWPTPIVISQEGGSILTGDNLENASEENPVREAFYRYFGNEFGERPSWDEMAVLYSVRGLGSYFDMITSGSGHFDGYQWQMVPGFRSYLSNRYSNPTYVRMIEDLLDQLPIGAHFEASQYAGWLPLSVEFDASPSIVGGNKTIERYLWDFGDGTSGEGETTAHEYAVPGIFEVQLTIVDNFGQSLKTEERIQASDPIFSPMDYFGDALNYERRQPDLWSTRIDSNDLRYYLNNEPRRAEISMPGFSFVKDSIYSDFILNFTTRIGEDLSQNNQADYSIVFGYENADNYNFLLMRHKTSRLVSNSNGRKIDIARISGKMIPDEDFHHVVFKLSGDELTVTVDDSVYLTTTSHRLPKEGQIGFGSTKSAVMFDDITITRPGDLVGIEHQESRPVHFKLYQNYPNPFNPSTRIQFALPGPEHVKIRVYNTIGQMLTTLLDRPLSAGSHQVLFSGQHFNSGVYLYEINAGNYQDVKKMILLK